MGWRVGKEKQQGDPWLISAVWGADEQVGGHLMFMGHENWKTYSIRVLAVK